MIFKKEITMYWSVEKKKEWGLEFEPTVELSKHGSSSGLVGLKVMIFLLPA